MNNAIGTTIGIALSIIVSKLLNDEKAYHIIAPICGLIAIGVIVYANIKYKWL